MQVRHRMDGVAESREVSYASDRASTISASAPPPGTMLTGKQEHCKQTSRLISSSSHLLTRQRSEARSHRSTDPIRNIRTLLPHRVSEIWSSFPLRCRRSSSRRVRTAITTVHLRTSCTQLSILGPGKGKGILAR